jgi:hypothetical protein
VARSFSPRAARIAAVIVLFACAACTGVLGLDEPTLDPCADHVCADASTGIESGANDASAASDADAGSATDATPDHVPSLTGIRCGGGSFGLSGCEGQTPVCCQETDDAGTTTYTCVANTASCAGYPISCSNYNDCAGTDVCCHFGSAIKCEPPSCASGSLVCEPDGAADQCPSGWTCKSMVTNAGVVSPYFVCAQ